jgi:adenosylcobalamin-dependent ribonucleoside-triphosphate reductase
MTETPWGPLGIITYARTYSRKKDNGLLETFEDTIDRVLKSAQTQLKVGFTPQELEELRGYLLSLKGIVAGRFLWQMGTGTVNQLGLFSLQNCSFVTVNHPIRPFTWAMDALMLGSGVGYNIQREYVYELPRVKHASITRYDRPDAEFIIPDSREGWIELLRRTMESHFITGKGFTFSTTCIRGAGAPIKGFGGVANGPEALAWGMIQISEVLNRRAGKKLRPIDALDVMNIIGFIVVSGNVRRSAQIAIGDYDDIQFLQAKRWDLGNVPNWRAMSNNSVVCNDFTQLPEQFWDGYLAKGEPYGLINLKLAQAIGRTGETQYPDPDVVGTNPCGEQGLASYETCCLAETFLPNIQSVEEMKRIAYLLYRINKHSLALACHHPETADIVHKNMRMGIGVTGYLQASEEQRKWLPEVYRYLREVDREYSAARGFPTSIKLTTVKPSGTLSLLAGTTSGCHPGYSKYYIRRIRIASNHSLVEACRNHGFPVEYVKNFDGTQDHSTVVVEFPCSSPEGTILAKDMNAIDQLEVVRRLQAEWSDNAVSCTVYYRMEELPAIREYLNTNYNSNFKSISFLLHSGHGFQQAPLEEISEEEYLRRKASSTLITRLESLSGWIDLDDCEAGGHCPIR